MRRPTRHRPHRWASGRRAPVTAAAGVAFLIAMAAAAPALAASAPPASEVAARLGARHIPAELVILVDVSQSMEWDGLYPVVKRELPLFLAQLKKQDPQDRVAVVVFGTRQDTRTVYVGPPATAISLPAQASSRATDFGYAFQRALDILSRASSRVKVGGVLLLSDGALNAGGDPAYDGYAASGWAKLRSRARRLGMTLTGYGLPLRRSRAGIDSVKRALGAVFAHRETLTPNLGDLGHELGLAQRRIMDDRVVSAVQPDSGRGIRVTWNGLPGSGGTPALSLGAGHAELRLRLTAMTHRVPLDVAGLTVAVSGLPVTVTGTVAGQRQSLAPGQSVTVPVHLTWRPLRRSSSSGTGPVHGRLALNGHVTSPFTHAIRTSFGDPKFAVGGLTGGASAPLAATVPGPFDYGPWLIVLLVVVAVAAGAVGMRTQVGGRLTLVAPGQAPVMMALPRFPWISRSTRKLIGVPGRITVHGTLRRKRMLIRLRLNRRTSTVIMKPWDQAIIAGIQVIHEPKSGGRRDTRPETSQEEGWQTRSQAG